MKRIISIVIASLAIMVAFVLLKYYVFDKWMPKATYGMRAICQKNDITDLYIGSSMFKQGISTNDLGEHTYLLAYNGNMPFMEAMQIGHLLENGAMFKRLVVDMYPYSMTREVSISDVKMLMDGDIKFTYDIFSAMKEEGEPITTFYEMLVLQNNEVFLTFPISFKLFNDRCKNGSNISVVHGKPEMTVDYIAGEEEGDIKDLQKEGLNRLINMCRNNNIEVVFLETPKYYKVHEDSYYNRLMLEYAQYLAEKNIKMILCEKTKNRLIGQIDEALMSSYSFDDSNAMYYTDLYHMSFEGRQELTKQLLRVM